MIRFSVHYWMMFTLMATTFPYFQLFLRARGFTESQVGYLLGLTAMAGVCGAIVMGHLADRLGRRRPLMAVCLLAFAATLVPLGATDAFWAAAVLVVGLGFAWRTVIPLTDALASAELDDPTHQYGKVRVWGSIGFVATLLGIRAAKLVDEDSSASMMTTMLAGAGLCLISSLLLPERPHRHRAGAPAADGAAAAPRPFDGVFWLFLLVAAMHQWGMTAYYSFFTLFLRERVKLDQAAWVWAIGPASEVPLLFYGGRIIRRFGLTRMLIAAMAAVSARLIIFAFVPPLWVILPVQLLHAMCFGLFHVASIEFVRRKVPPARRGLAMALYMALALGLPNWLGSSLGGNVVERWGFAALFAAYAVAPVIGIALAFTARRKLDLPAPLPAGQNG
jgi:PPP family 3-phenylpropionic acid transporter